MGHFRQSCRIRTALLLLLLLVCPFASFSQTVYRAEGGMIQPLVYRNKGVLWGCGLRTAFMTNVPEKMYSAELSVNLFKENDFYFGGVKVLYHAPPKQGAKKLEVVPIKSFSINIAPNHYIEVREIKAGKDDGSLFGGIELDSATEMMASILEGKRIEIGYQLASEKGVRIFSVKFKPLDAEDSKVFFDCFESLMQEK